MEETRRPVIPLLEPPAGEERLSLFRRYPWLLGMRNGLGLVLLIGGLVYMVWLSTVRSREQLETVFTDERSEASQVEQLRSVGYDKEGKTWEVFSAKAERHRRSGTSEIEDVQVLNIYKEGRINITGHADRSSYDSQRKLLNLFDNVELRDREESTRLLTNQLSWAELTEELRCPSPVDVRVEDNHIVADSMFADRDLIHLEFVGRVRMYLRGIERENLLTREGVLKPEDLEKGEEENEGLWVSAGYVYYDKETRRATCYPSVPANVKRRWGLDRPAQNLPQTRPGRPWSQTEQVITSAEQYLRADTWREAQAIDILFGPKIPDALQERRTRQVLAWRGNKRLFADRLDIDMADKRLEPRRDAFFYAESMEDQVDADARKVSKAIAKEVTSVASDQMSIYWKKGIVEAWDGVEAYQRDKRITALHMLHHDEIAILTADGNVAIHQASGDWLAREGLLSDMEEERAREDARKPTTVYCDALLVYTEPGYMYCAGNVKVIQPEQRAWADLGEYHDGEQWMTLQGNVDYANTKGESIQAAEMRLFFDVRRYELFEAKKVTVLMPDKYARKIDEAKRENEE